MGKRKIVVLLLSLNFAILAVLGGMIYQTQTALAEEITAREENQAYALIQLAEGLRDLERTLQKAQHATSPALITELGTRLYGNAREARVILRKLQIPPEDAAEIQTFLEITSRHAQTMVQTGRIDLERTPDTISVFAPAPYTNGVEQARQQAAAFANLPQSIFTHTESALDSPAYTFQARVDGGDFVIEVRPPDGQILRAENTRTVRRSNLTHEEGLEQARDLIARTCHATMTLHHWWITDHTLTAEFFHTQDQILHYPDRITVSIALDNGRLTGFDAQDYLQNHRARDLPELRVCQDQAMEAIPETLQIQAHHLALRITSTGQETLSHAFQAQDLAGQSYMVYVSAITGQQEAIYALTDTETGFFTNRARA